MRKHFRLFLTVLLGLILVAGFEAALSGSTRAHPNIPPVVVDLNPIPNVHTAPRDTTVSVTYDQDLDPATVDYRSFAVHAMQTGWLSETLAVQGGMAVLTPTQLFHPGEFVQASATTATLTLVGGEGPISPTAWQFWAGVQGGTGYFVDSTQTLGNNWTVSAALGDLNGDGDLDTFVTNYNNQPDRVWINDGSGVFTDSGQALGTFNSGFVALGDLDADGDLDAFVTALNITQANRVYINDGSGTFTDSGQTLGYFESSGVALGDLDGDGDLDAFYLNRFGLPNRVYFNDGYGAFTDSGQALGSHDSADVALGDLDRDGDLDALITNPDTGSGGGPTEIWLNDGVGFFTLHQSLGSYLSTGVDLGDLDGDGDLDAVFSAGGLIATRPKVVLQNDGSGTFTEIQLLGTAFGADIALGDLDSDGDLDIYATNGYSTDEVWWNDGDGVFSNSGQALDTCYSSFLDLGDLDDDGDLDVFLPCGGIATGQPNKVWFNETWFEGESMPEAFGGPGFAQCADDPDSFYLVGGGGPGFAQWRNQFYKFNATTNNWEVKDSLPQGLFGVAATCYEGKIYAAGGWRGYAVRTLYIYDIATDNWTAGPDLPRFVSGAALAAWDGKLYLAGGSRYAIPTPPVAVVDIYDIASETWHPAVGPNMLVPAAYAGWVQQGRYLYTVGGMSGDYNNNVTATQQLDLAAETLTWETGPAFSSQRAFLALATTGTHLYAIGGDVNGSQVNGQTALVESLDLSLWPGGAWTDTYDPIPQALMTNVGFCTEARVGGEIWAVGGFYGINPNYTSVDTNLYHPAEPCHDFSFGDLAPESLEGAGFRGATTSYTLTVFNAGTLMDTYTVTVSGNAWTTTVPAEVGPVAPGASNELVVAVAIPEDATIGSIDTAQITLRSQADSSMADTGVITSTATPSYGLMLDPDTIAQSGPPGTTLTTALHLTNTGALTDTFSLDVSGNLWAVHLPITQTILAAGEGITVAVEVTIPAGAADGMVDSVTITAASQGDPLASASGVLTTTAVWWKNYLPMINH